MSSLKEMDLLARADEAWRTQQALSKPREGEGKQAKKMYKSRM